MKSNLDACVIFMLVFKYDVCMSVCEDIFIYIHWFTNFCIIMQEKFPVMQGGGVTFRSPLGEFQILKAVSTRTRWMDDDMTGSEGGSYRCNFLRESSANCHFNYKNIFFHYPMSNILTATLALP